jgi:uncharacterized membrane protein YGL010W
MPATVDEWADQFGRLRASAPSALSAWLGIPIVITALIGLLWAIPVPDILTDASPVINAATLFIMASFVYYCILSIPLAIGGLLFLISAAIPSAWLDQTEQPLWPVAAGVFVIAFAWQLTETRRATGRLLVLRNLQYVMLGPIWLLRGLYRRAGLRY